MWKRVQYSTVQYCIVQYGTVQEGEPTHSAGGWAKAKRSGLWTSGRKGRYGTVLVLYCTVIKPGIYQVDDQIDQPGGGDPGLGGALAQVEHCTVQYCTV